MQIATSSRDEQLLEEEVEEMADAAAEQSAQHARSGNDEDIVNVSTHPSSDAHLL